MLLTLTPAQWKTKAREEVGDVSKNHIFELRLPLSSDGGTWRAFFNGSRTSALAYNASASEVAATLCELDTVGPEGFAVAGLRKGPYYVESKGEIGAMNLHGFLTTESSLIPGGQVTVVDHSIGQMSSYASEVDSLWAGMDEGDIPFQIRYLVIKIEVGKRRLGSLLGQVDTRDRDYEEKRSQSVRQARDAVNDATNALTSLESQLGLSGGNVALVGKIERPSEWAEDRPQSWGGQGFYGRDNVQSGRGR